eukprot:CAMPEP_0201714002 /NCGR_PEP_ID=MMETSP0593-20130828/639_1 /ASSEMBLY_ACC=CAM_ASM_000672 /TAXON_ID=267983 /ORGANISM="Skeletonema japonicum, Strain CCMP2506" /LENGTH=714 /DNA_ID=CAMNT_0048203223 /DNA_START=46 /DNA_END=2190 /DNA_ORIENTATION=-
MFGDRNKLVTSLLEKSGAVCGSIKNTIQDEDNIEWVRSKTEHIQLKGVECARNTCENAQHDYQEYEDTHDIDFSHTDLSENMSETYDDLTYDDITRDTRDRDQTIATDDTSIYSGVMEKSRGAPLRGKSAVGSVPSVGSSSAGAGHTVVIGLCLSRRSGIGHADTVTRQSEFDFNELQDRDYKYVSSTDEQGWLAGGGERRDPYSKVSEEEVGDGTKHKIPAADTVHIPIIQINAASISVVNEIVSALARGEIFIPHMSIMPETLTVKGKSPPDLVVSFGCERNDDVNPEDWSNWCLEFLHNQLYEYFEPLGAVWSKRPFQITLARKVKWKTIKHMNKYFARSEDVINSWREKGPQYLTPQKDALGVTHEEVVRSHGIYLIRNGEATNYFPPNFEPPYTTNVTRSLIKNVVNKSWDSKHRDWLMEPVPRYRGPIQIISSMIGLASPPGCATIKKMDISFDVSCADDVDLVTDAYDLEERLPRKERKKQKTTLKQKKAPLQEKKTPLKEMKPYDSIVGKEMKTTNIDHESVESNPRLRLEEQQNIDDVNRGFDETSVRSHRTEATNTDKYARTKSKRKEMRDRRQDLSEERGVRDLASPAQATTMSMNYSVDSASHFFRQPVSSANRGASILSVGTEDPSLISYVTRSTMGPAKNPGAADDVSLSILESKSTIVPSDEDLIAIGWAKAYDPNTESYYYFTLDRSKTAWENPLLSP